MPIRPAQTARSVSPKAVIGGWLRHDSSARRGVAPSAAAEISLRPQRAGQTQLPFTSGPWRPGGGDWALRVELGERPLRSGDRMSEVPHRPRVTRAAVGRGSREGGLRAGARAGDESPARAVPVLDQRRGVPLVPFCVCPTAQML